MRKYPYLATCGIGLLALTGCIDDKYDLSDIDTTIELKAKDLTLPVNIDDVTLGDIIDLKDGNLKIIDGQYVFTSDGDFHSDEINVDAIDIKSPYISPSRKSIVGAATASGNVEYPVESDFVSFEYRSTNVSEHILAIKNIKTTLRLSIEISVVELKDVINAMHFTDLEIKLPTDVSMIPDHGSYDPETGVLSIPSATADGDVLRISADVTQINLPTEAASFNPVAHTFEFSDRMRLQHGTLSLDPADYAGGTLPMTMTLVTQFRFSDLHADKFTGRIDYNLDGFNINPVSLSDIPDMLNQTGTDITLLNPQIYMSVNNPVASYNLDAHAGMTLTPVRDNVSGNGISLDNGTFTIGHGDGTGPYDFCLSPTVPATYPEGYPSPEHVPFTDLGKVLAGSGLPQTISIDIDNAGIAPQDVTDFTLGVGMGQVEGTYLFYAPLAMGANSKIVYAETKDGWSDETLDKMTIQKLEVTTTATNSTPFDIEVSGYPIDKEGHRINGVEVVGARLAKGATAEKVTIRTTGEVKGLDGFTFTATLLAPQSTPTLTPDSNISLKEIRATVSGNYIDEL